MDVVDVVARTSRGSGSAADYLRIEANPDRAALKIIFDAELQIVIESDLGDCRMNGHLQLRPIQLRESPLDEAIILLAGVDHQRVIADVGSYSQTRQYDRGWRLSIPAAEGAFLNIRAGAAAGCAAEALRVTHAAAKIAQLDARGPAAAGPRPLPPADRRATG